MSTPKRLIIRWTTLKGLTAILLFLITTVLIEYLFVLYAINLGVNDNPIKWSLQFPGTQWTTTMVVSPLFHLVPTAVIIVLAFTWIYLTRHVTVKTHEPPPKAKAEKRRAKVEKEGFLGKIKSKLLGIKSVAYMWQKIHFARATIKSALTVFLVFLVFAFTVSLLAYPKLVHQTVSNAYQNNPSLLNTMKGIAQALAPLGAISNVFLPVAPAFGDFVQSLGVITKPLAELDNNGKYLVFQNVAAWVSALSALFYGEVVAAKKRRKG
ncbi:MAG: hypothetical protein QW270_07915 [Candidatus Bathyarchaeia archaeon]